MSRESWRRWLVPGAPFALSLALSLSTVGTQVYWQDSGLFLAAVHELGVLYPPGFVLYLLLCKAWTALFFFIDFTLAVHLFSSACAALAAAVLALAARDLLRSRGLFRIADGDPGPLEDAAAAAAACLAASGYTFWLSGTYAKGYALLYLVLALLLWRIVRAAETRSPRDLTQVAALIGLAWAAHPSVTAAGLALALFVGMAGRAVGWKGVAWRAALAAGLAMGPTLLLPLLAARDPEILLGEPRTPRDFLAYLTGRRFTAVPGAWGFDESRWLSMGLYFVQETLAVGAAAVLAGLVKLARANRLVLAFIAAWVVPYSVVTVLFKLEGQHDYWFVAAWLPLHLAAAAGLWAIGRAAGRRAVWVVAGTAAAGILCAALVNAPLVSQRGYALARHLGEVTIGRVDPGAVVVVRNDHTLSILAWLQRVERYRTDVAVVWAPYLEHREGGRPSAYDERLLRQRPGLEAPDYAGMRARFPGAAETPRSVAAFVNANAGARPVFVEPPLAEGLLDESWTLVPAGPLLKAVRRGAGEFRPEYWTWPVEPEDLRRRYRRERGQSLKRAADGSIATAPEAYERQLMSALLRSRRHLAWWREREGTPEGKAEARRLLDSVLRLGDPE